MDFDHSNTDPLDEAITDHSSSLDPKSQYHRTTVNGGLSYWQKQTRIVLESDKWETSGFPLDPDRNTRYVDFESIRGEITRQTYVAREGVPLTSEHLKYIRTKLNEGILFTVAVPHLVIPATSLLSQAQKHGFCVWAIQPAMAVLLTDERPRCGPKGGFFEKASDQYAVTGPGHADDAYDKMINIIRESQGVIRIIAPYFNLSFLELLEHALLREGGKEYKGRSVETEAGQTQLGEEQEEEKELQIHLLQVLTMPHRRIDTAFHMAAMRLKDGLRKRGAALEIFVAQNRARSRELHDRYLYSRGKRYNICPMDAIVDAKWSLIQQLPAHVPTPEFEAYLDQSWNYFKLSEHVLKLCRRLQQVGNFRSILMHPLRSFYNSSSQIDDHLDKKEAL